MIPQRSVNACHCHRISLTRSKDSDSSLSRQTKKFRDFIFKRQYTAFDSQNKESAQSPFHGFFTLFWMGTGIFMIQTAAKNFATYGNIFGSNDLMHIMFERDLITLALSDGLLWIATGFGWALQRMVVKGWLSWDREGWIIQHVSITCYSETKSC